MSDTDFDSKIKELDEQINSKIIELDIKINNIKKKHKINDNNKNIIIDIFSDEIKNIETINNEINKEIGQIKSTNNNTQTVDSSKTY